MTVEKVVGAKYVMVDNSTYIGENYAVGTVITLIDDDGTAMPLFSDADGNKKYVRMRDVVQIVGEVPAETKEVPKLKFTELQKDTVYVAPDVDYDMIASVEKAVNQEKPKFAVGDLVTTDGILGTADWDIARRVTAVNMETRKYEMEWADGSVSGINSLLPFTEADAFLTNYTGKVPTEETVAQSHITADQFAAIKVGDKLKLRTDLEEMDVFGGAWVNSEMISLAKDGVTPTVEYIDSDATVRAKTDWSAWYYTAEMIAEVIPAEPEFDCPELGYGNIYTDNDGWTFRYTKTDNKKRGAEVTGGPTIDYDGDYHFSNDGFIHFYKWRKATAEETAKLEAAEKEHGYVPPLVNEVGTVIEAGKYYVLTGSAGTKRICKVYATQHKAGVFYKKPVLVDLEGCHTVSTDMEYTDLGSPYGKSAVPATEEQIALYDAAVAWHEAQKAFREVA